VRLLIDGYNLLHATDLFGAGELAGTLRGSREALLNFLAARLGEGERRDALVVFDASEAPPHLPDSVMHGGIAVRFARGYASADALIEEVLSVAKGTRHLTVVSGDHRVQRAARSRGAKPIDSGPWFRDLARRTPHAESAPLKPEGEVLDAEHWVRAFSDPKLEAEVRRAESGPSTGPKPAGATPPPAPPESTPAKKPRKRRSGGPLSQGRRPIEEFGAGLADQASVGGVFPPGYGEDLLDGRGQA
jgi:uncharacterized protein